MDAKTRSERFAAKYSQQSEGGRKEMNVMGRRLQIYKIFHTKAIAIPLIIKRIAILF